MISGMVPRRGGHQSRVTPDPTHNGQHAGEAPRRDFLGVSQEDLQWLEELRMLSDLIIAAARTSEDALEEEDIHRILGPEH
jgi:hypothetical protein